MCDPATLGMAVLNGVGQMAAINEQNAAASRNSMNARLAANAEFESETNKFLEQQRSLIQGGFDAVLEGRANQSAAYASAVQNGVQGASVKAVLRDQRQKAARSASRASQEMDSLSNQTGANFKHITEKTKGRIASVPFTSWGIGDTAQVLAPIVRSQVD